MFCSLIFISAFLASQLDASAIRVPVHVAQPKISKLIEKRSLAENAQAPLPDPSVLKGNLNYPFTPVLHGILGPWPFLISLTPGTPSQSPLTILLSLFPTDLFLLSTLNTSPIFQNSTHYNSSLSNTYISNGTTTKITSFPAAFASGIIAQDTIGIAGMEIKGRQFVEAEEAEFMRFPGEKPYEGALGLGRKGANSSLEAGNLVSDMYSQQLIPHETFSLTAPHLLGEFSPEEGELAFGIDIENKGVKMLDSTNKTLDFPNWNHVAWGLPLNEVNMGDGKLIGSGRLNATTAWITGADDWFIRLPGDMADEMHRLMGANRLGWSPFFGLNCKVRENLPDLVFAFGDQDTEIEGHRGGEVEVRIGAYDYTIVDDDEGRVCVSMLASTEVWDTVFLGAGFLRGVKTFFDVGGSRIGFEELDHRPRK